VKIYSTLTIPIPTPNYLLPGECRLLPDGGQLLPDEDQLLPDGYTLLPDAPKVSLICEKGYLGAAPR
jgi:hypothetical protein